MPKSPRRRTSMTMCFGIGALSVRGGSEPPGIQGKTIGQHAHFAANLRADLLALNIFQNARDESGHLSDLRFAESPRGDRGTAETHAAGIEGRILIERN